MNLRFIGVGLLAAVASMSLAACGGGGSSPGAATPPQSAPQSAKATGTLKFKLSNTTPKTVTTHSGLKPAYVSPVTTSATLFIDSGVPGTTGTCTPFTPPAAICSIPFTTTTGPHIFAVETDDGINILSEGTASYTLSPGDNTTYLSANPLTLNGVADSVNVGPDGEFLILDGATFIITSPGTFDNGPLTVTSSDTSVATITSPTSLASPGPGLAIITATYACSSTLASSAPFNVVVSEAASPTPSIPLLLTPSLTYGPPTPPVLGTSPPITCAASGATGTVTIQSRTKR